MHVHLSISDASRTSAPVIEAVRALCTDTLEDGVVEGRRRVHGSLPATVAQVVAIAALAEETEIALGPPGRPAAPDVRGQSAASNSGIGACATSTGTHHRPQRKHG